LCSCRITGMKIFTNTLRVKKARESILEFLLVNHPLDCPICDQGGECDLQDIVMFLDLIVSILWIWETFSSDKSIGPFIKTSMNRCIHCTRCVRFSSIILVLMSWELQAEVCILKLYLYKSTIWWGIIGQCYRFMSSCALTSKPGAFLARLGSW